jgi:hypothetical protein
VDVADRSRLEHAAHAVRRYWIDGGVAGAAISAQEIAAAEARLGALPEAYRRFLAIAGSQRLDDDNFMRFWPPAELRSASDVLVGAGCLAVPDAIVIADHMQESWWYVLFTGGPRAGLVALVLGGDPRDPQEPIGDLATFLEQYMADATALYPP